MGKSFKLGDWVYFDPSHPKISKLCVDSERGIIREITPRTNRPPEILVDWEVCGLAGTWPADWLLLV